MCTLEIYFLGNIAVFTYRVFHRIISICLTSLFFHHDDSDENIIYLSFKEIYVAVSRHSYKRPQIEILLRNQCSLQSSVFFLTVPSSPSNRGTCSHSFQTPRFVALDGSSIYFCIQLHITWFPSGFPPRGLMKIT